MTPDWTDLGPIAAFPEGAPVLRKDEGGRRFACVRVADCVHVVDDRCPHQGYPLSQGSARDGVLTCEWHNWKFDLASGACTFGGEAVRRYPTRVEDGRVHLDRAIDRGAEARRLTASLREALAKDDVGRALREALRLGALGIGAQEAGVGLGALAVGFELCALDGAERGEYGFDHGLALLADLTSWVERGWVGAEEAFVQAAHAIAEPSLHLGRRGATDARGGLARLVDLEGIEPNRVAEALVAERRDEAEARVRALSETRGPEGVRDALLPFVTRHLYDYGHGAIFLTKALELGRRFPAAATEVLASATAMLSWATADTALPPFTATREALGRVAEMSLAAGAGGGVIDRRAYEDVVLSGERDAVRATLEQLGAGVDPVGLLRAIARAAARRLRRFDLAWEHRVDAEVGVLDVTHAVTFAEAAITLAGAKGSGADGRHAARLAVIGAGFVGKLRRADAASPAEATRASGSLASAAAARDVGRALAIVAEMDAAARREAYRELAPFAALDAAVRPIFYAHTVKVTEALHRLEASDPEADGTYLDALVSYLVPMRPENRARRIAAVARKFLEDGRPPEGLY